MVVSASTQTLANYLATGYWQDSGQAPHRFDTSASNVISVNLTALTTAGQVLARTALSAWEAVANISFKEVTSGAKISFDDNQAGAFHTAQYYNTGYTLSAHVNVSTSWLSSYGTAVGSLSFQTYMHEIGHALGLGHSGNYNTSAQFEADAKFSNDSWQQTLMSYFDQDQNTLVDASKAFCLTPMTADILAIQQLYGVATGGPAAGNTIYGVGSDLGTYLDAAFSAGSLARNAMTIFDASGIDLINFSSDTRAQEVNLNAGTFSSVYGLRGNLGIALGTIVENYIAGSGSDRVTGNAAANILWGLAGNDVLDGGLGTDRLEGGAGNDLYILATAGDTVVEAVNAGIDQVNAGYSYTLGANLENLLLTGTAAITGAGNALANRLTGNAAANLLNGSAGNDTLDGGLGDDVLVGGAGWDILIGGAGSDDFVFMAISDSASSSTTCDVVSGGFTSGYDDIVVSGIDANAGLAGDQAFALDTNGSFSQGEIRQSVLSSGLLVEFNTDTDTAVEMAILIQGLASRLAATDFVL